MAGPAAGPGRFRREPGLRNNLNAGETDRQHQSARHGAGDRQPSTTVPQAPEQHVQQRSFSRNEGHLGTARQDLQRRRRRYQQHGPPVQTRRGRVGSREHDGRPGRRAQNAQMPRV